jgi:hypothetical protein
MSNEECTVIKRQTLKKESAADVERSIGRKDPERGWRSGLKEPDEVSEVPREHLPDESEKSALTQPKLSETGGGRSRVFERIMIDQLASWGGQNLLSIVILAPVHVSKLSRVLKKLTAQHTGDSFNVLSI